MQPTRRTWAVVWLAVLATAAAWLFARPALLMATAALGAWLVGAAYAYLRTATAVDDALALEVTATPARAVVDDDVEVTVRGAPVRTAATVTARLRLPPSLSTDAAPDDATIRLVESVPAETTISVTPQVAGEFTVPSPAVTITDAGNLFTETVTRGPTAPLSVVPRRPDDLSLGATGREVATLEGEYSNERRSRGTEPAEIRRYIPGETADRIDWNATARLAETYVREFEVESALETRFLFDARTASRTGASGETPLDYLREVALGLLSLSQDYGDPVGLAVVDDDGVASMETPKTQRGGYDRIRRTLRTLDPEPRRRRPGRGGDTATLARRLTAVDRSDSQFVETLSASLTDRTPLPADRSPVRAAIRSITRSNEGRTVLFTDDTDRREVREAVEEARQETGTVLVFLAPTVLFEPDALTDLPTAYERYMDFESFCRTLEALDGVTTIEVNPGERSRQLRNDHPELAP